MGECVNMVHVRILFGGLTEDTRRTMQTIDVSSENYMHTIHVLIRHSLNIDEMLAFDILIRNPQRGSRGLVRLSNLFCENMELGRVLKDFDDDVHDEVIFGRENLYITIRTRSGPYMSPVPQYVQNGPTPPHVFPAASEHLMNHRPYV